MFFGRIVLTLSLGMKENDSKALNLDRIERQAMAADKSAILVEIERTFDELYATYGEPLPHTLSSISTAECQADLETYGLYLVGDTFRPELYRFNLLNLSRELYTIIFDVAFPLDVTLEHLIAYPNPEFQAEFTRISTKYRGVFTELGEFVLAALTSFWNSSHGFGNSNFRFIYRAFVDTNPQFAIDGIETAIEFNSNPIHRVDLRLLAYYPQLWELLKSLYPEGRPMVSWDSQKVRFQDTGKLNGVGLSKISKATAPTMTARHHDIYTYGGTEMDRVQAMLISQHPNAVALGYVLFSNHPRIRTLLQAYFGREKPNFGSVEDADLNPILDKYWRAPLNGFIIWSQPTIHYEGLALNIPSTHLRRYGGSKATPESLRCFSFRAVIGTHTPIELSPRALKQLCFLSEQGWLPEIYKHKKHNAGTPIQKNLVNSKSTQYFKARTMTTTEDASLTLIRPYYTPESIDIFVESLPPIIREMYGLY